MSFEISLNHATVDDDGGYAGVVGGFDDTYSAVMGVVPNHVQHHVHGA